MAQGADRGSQRQYQSQSPAFLLSREEWDDLLGNFAATQRSRDVWLTRFPPPALFAMALDSICHARDMLQKLHLLTFLDEHGLVLLRGTPEAPQAPTLPSPVGASLAPEEAAGDAASSVRGCLCRLLHLLAAVAPSSAGSPSPAPSAAPSPTHSAGGASASSSSPLPQSAAGERAASAHSPMSSPVRVKGSDGPSSDAASLSRHSSSSAPSLDALRAAIPFPFRAAVISTAVSVLIQVDAQTDFPDIFWEGVRYLLALAQAANSDTERRLRFAACTALAALEAQSPGTLQGHMGAALSWVQSERSYARQSATLLLLTLLESFCLQGVSTPSEAPGASLDDQSPAALAGAIPPHASTHQHLQGLQGAPKAPATLAPASAEPMPVHGTVHLPLRPPGVPWALSLSALLDACWDHSSASPLPFPPGRPTRTLVHSPSAKEHGDTGALTWATEDVRALRRVLSAALEASSFCAEPAVASVVLLCAEVAAAVGASSITQLLSQNFAHLRHTSSHLLFHASLMFHLQQHRQASQPGSSLAVAAPWLLQLSHQGLLLRALTKPGELFAPVPARVLAVHLAQALLPQRDSYWALGAATQPLAESASAGSEGALVAQCHLAGLVERHLSLGLLDPLEVKAVKLSALARCAALLGGAALSQSMGQTEHPEGMWSRRNGQTGHPEGVGSRGNGEIRHQEWVGSSQGALPERWTALDAAARYTLGASPELSSSLEASLVVRAVLEALASLLPGREMPLQGVSSWAGPVGPTNVEAPESAAPGAQHRMAVPGCNDSFPPYPLASPIAGPQFLGVLGWAASTLLSLCPSHLPLLLSSLSRLLQCGAHAQTVAPPLIFALHAWLQSALRQDASKNLLRVYVPLLERIVASKCLPPDSILQLITCALKEELTCRTQGPNPELPPVPLSWSAQSKLCQLGEDALLVCRSAMRVHGRSFSCRAAAARLLGLLSTRHPLLHIRDTARLYGQLLELSPFLENHPQGAFLTKPFGAGSWEETSKRAHIWDLALSPSARASVAGNMSDTPRMSVPPSQALELRRLHPPMAEDSWSLLLPPSKESLQAPAWAPLEVLLTHPLIRAAPEGNSSAASGAGIRARHVSKQGEERGPGGSVSREPAAPETDAPHPPRHMLLAREYLGALIRFLREGHRYSIEIPCSVSLVGPTERERGASECSTSSSELQRLPPPAGARGGGSSAVARALTFGDGAAPARGGDGQGASSCAPLHKVLIPKGEAPGALTGHMRSAVVVQGPAGGGALEAHLTGVEPDKSASGGAAAPCAALAVVVQFARSPWCDEVPDIHVPCLAPIEGRAAEELAQGLWGRLGLPHDLEPEDSHEVPLGNARQDVGLVEVEQGSAFWAAQGPGFREWESEDEDEDGELGEEEEGEEEDGFSETVSVRVTPRMPLPFLLKPFVTYTTIEGNSVRGPLHPLPVTIEDFFLPLPTVYRDRGECLIRDPKSVVRGTTSVPWSEEDRCELFEALWVLFGETAHCATALGDGGGSNSSSQAGNRDGQEGFRGRGHPSLEVSRDSVGGREPGRPTQGPDVDSLVLESIKVVHTTPQRALQVVRGELHAFIICDTASMEGDAGRYLASNEGSATHPGGRGSYAQPQDAVLSSEEELGSVAAGSSLALVLLQGDSSREPASLWLDQCMGSAPSDSPRRDLWNAQTRPLRQIDALIHVPPCFHVLTRWCFYYGHMEVRMRADDWSILAHFEEYVNCFLASQL